MALDNYANLKNTVIDFAGRDDLSENMDDFIALTEEMMFNNDDQPLLFRGLETVTQLATVAGDKTVALPASYLKARKATIEYGGVERELIVNSPSALQNVTDSGIPAAFAITDTILLDRKPDGVYTINFYYYAKPTPLSSANPTNAVLTSYPSIYLNGCLSALYDMTGELDRSEHYYQKMIRSIKGAIRSDKQGGNAPAAQARVRGYHP